MNSCLYFGRVRHRRYEPVAHAFDYRLFLVALDLSETSIAFKGRWLWSTRRPAPIRFHRADHLGPATEPLDGVIRALVTERIGRRPEGRIVLLTNLRHFGYVQNPVCFYFCFAASGEGLEAVVAEVTNTPWGERHAYVVDAQGRTRGSFGGEFQKALHVSPFFSMNQRYVWRLTTYTRRMVVHMENWEGGQRVFDATMKLERKPLDGPTCAWAFFIHPFMTWKVLAAIYWQALRLRLKGARFHVHPRRLAKREKNSQ